MSNDKISKKFDKTPSHKPPKSGQCDSFHGHVVEDPFRPLEDLTSPETKAWVNYQNERFEAFISDYPNKEERRAFLTGAINYPKETIPTEYGGLFFSEYNEGVWPQFIYQVREELDGEARVLIDPNKLNEKGTISLKDIKPSPDGKYVAYGLSEDGDDAEIVRIINVATGENLQDIIPDCRFTQIDWDRDSHAGFVYTSPANDGTKRVILKHHTLGQPASEDKIIFMNDEHDTGVANLIRPECGQYEWVFYRIGTERRNALYVRPIGSQETFIKLYDPGIAKYVPVGEVGNKIYIVTNLDAPMGKLVAIDIDNPNPENWETIIPENPQDQLNNVFVHKNKLYAQYSHDAADQVKIFSPEGILEGEIPVPPQSSIAFSKINQNSDTLLLKIGGYLEPGSLYSFNTNSYELEMIKPTQAPETLNKCLVERLYATSKDGTKVPMTVIRHPNTILDGTAALRLYGYGGFSVSLEPAYSFRVLEWVKQGGIMVVTNLRGGGEFGKEWYDQGRLHNKQNVFDDFIACAETLIEKNYTSTPRLVIEGGSNGGLLTAACMLQRPDLYGAVVCDVPVLDMLRYHLSTFGAFWKSDYGDPTVNEEDFNVSMRYSPIHNVQEGVDYPPILISTAAQDTRVVPWHAYKFAALLQEHSPQSLVLLSVEQNAGHGAGKPIQKIIDDFLSTNAFIESVIGPIDQAEYKKNPQPSLYGKLTL